MRDRLVDLINEANEKCRSTKNCDDCSACDTGDEPDDCLKYNIADHLLANGVIVPPCKDENTDYKKLYENLLEDFEHALHFAGKNNNVCNFCEHDCGEKGICKGREVNFRCQPKWRGIMKSKGSEE